jgi:uncharacterized protein (TIGR03437 family)
MKLCAAVVPLFLAAASIVTAGPVNSQRYFRPKTEKSKPKQTSNPVVVNAASYLPGVSPGGLATMFGQNLADVTGIVYAGTNPLPTQLAGVMVLVNGVAAPIYGVALADDQDQISFQVPYETPVGQGTVQIIVTDEGDQVASIETDSYTEDPGIFLYNGNYAVAELPDYSLIGPDNPASPGDTIVMYVTGLGPLDLDLTNGYGAPSTPPFATTVDPFQVQVNGEDCNVLFSGLGPGFVGLYQVNFTLPSDLPAGNLNVQIFSTYSNSGIAVLPVQ